MSCREFLNKESRYDRTVGFASPSVAYHSGAGRSTLGRRKKWTMLMAIGGRGRYMRSDMIASRKWTVLSWGQGSPNCSSIPYTTTGRA